MIQSQEIMANGAVLNFGLTNKLMAVYTGTSELMNLLDLGTFVDLKKPSQAAIRQYEGMDLRNNIELLLDLVKLFMSVS